MSENGSFSMRKIPKILRKLAISNNTLLLVKSGTALVREDVLEKILDELSKTHEGICIAVVDDLADIEAISEEKMNSVGWFKAPQILEYLKWKKEREKDV
jgi:hypothetical protein